MRHLQAGTLLVLINGCAAVLGLPDDPQLEQPLVNQDAASGVDTGISQINDASDTGLPTAVDASDASDARVTADADAAPDAAGCPLVNLLKNPSFETDLSFWNAPGADIDQRDEGRNGSGGARVCRAQSNEYVMSQTLNLPAGNYVLVSWVKARDTEIPMVRAEFTRNTTKEDTFPALTRGIWTCKESTFLAAGLTSPTTVALRATYTQPNLAGACMLYDDLALYSAPSFPNTLPAGCGCP
jgi:hypothetical protein